MIIKETGTIKVLNAEQSGTSKAGTPWTSREMVIEVRDEGFINHLHFKVFGRDCDELRNASVGDTVEVRYKPQSREFNGRWYDEHRVYGLTLQTKETPVSIEDNKGDLPF